MPGQDLTRVTIPPFFLEPRSLLERECGQVELCCACGAARCAARPRKRVAGCAAGLAEWSAARACFRAVALCLRAAMRAGRGRSVCARFHPRPRVSLLRALTLPPPPSFLPFTGMADLMMHPDLLLGVNKLASPVGRMAVSDAMRSAA